MFGGRFGVARTTLKWTSQGNDGTYVDADSKGNLNLANIVTGNTTVFVDVSTLAPAVQTYYGYSIQPSGQVSFLGLANHVMNIVPDKYLSENMYYLVPIVRSNTGILISQTITYTM